MESTFVHEYAVKLLTATVYVFSDSVLWFGGRCEEFPQSVQSWLDKIGWSVDSTPYRELDSIDGEPVEFEWRISQAPTTSQVLDEVQTHPFNFKDRITCLCRCTLTFTGTTKETKEGANNIQPLKPPMPNFFQKDNGIALGPGDANWHWTSPAYLVGSGTALQAK